MKLLKQMNPYLLVLLFAISFTACSDNEGLDELNEDQADLRITATTNTRAAGFIDCNDYAINSGPQAYLEVEYVPFLTVQEKHAIRLAYHQAMGNSLFCVNYDYELSNPDTELWLVEGWANARPKAQWPEDPDIKRVSAQ